MGQSKKKRVCPAVGRNISAAECGDNRLSHYACPETCPFNPFSPINYGQQLEIEDRLDGAILEAFAHEQGDSTAFSDRVLAASRGHPAHGQHAVFVRSFFFDRDAAGRTFAERWTANGLMRERNDQRVMFRHKAQMCIMLLEIQRIADDRELHAVDLLSPQPVPLRFLDISLAASVTRFTTVLAWCFPTPHFWRLSGTAIDLNDVAPLPAMEVLDACVRHLRGPDAPEARPRWLAENFERIAEVLTATGLARRRDMFAAMDGLFGSATYEIRGTVAECHAALATESGIDRDEVAPAETRGGFDSAYVWFDRAREGDVPLPGRRVLGRILVGPRELRVEAIGGARLDELRERIEAKLGRRIAFSRERRDDLAGQLIAQDPGFDPALVPPRLLETPRRIELGSSRLPAPPPGVDLQEFEAAARAEMQRRMLDDRIPALGNTTPREAATRPEMRPALLEWAKGLVRSHDRINLQTGRTDDINGFIRTLGLTELDVPAPPLRAIPEDLDEDDETDDDLDDEYDYRGDEIDFDENDERSADAADWSAPPLPPKPLSFEESMARLRGSLDAFDSAGAAIEEMELSAPALLDSIAKLCAAQMGADEFNVLTVFLVQTWFALVPRGATVSFSSSALCAGIDRRWKLLEKGGELSKRTMDKLVLDSSQPDFAAAVAAQFLQGTANSPPEMQLSPEATLHGFIVLGALIEELDRAQRR